MNIASLFAKVGFKIDENDLNSVKQALSSIRDKIDELVTATAQFASSLTRLSKNTGLTKKLLQDFHNLGTEAGLATDEIDSMLETMANVANKAYWGLGNQFAQWGLFFGRGETSASALIKVLNQLNKSSPQKQREMANELGLPLDSALMLAEKFKKSGFNTKDYFNLTDNEVDTMHNLNVELMMLDHRWEGFKRKLTAGQGDRQLGYYKKINEWLETIGKKLVKFSGTSFGNGLIGTITLGTQLISPILNHADEVFQLGIGFWGLAKSVAPVLTGVAFIWTKALKPLLPLLLPLVAVGGMLGGLYKASKDGFLKDTEFGQDYARGMDVLMEDPKKAFELLVEAIPGIVDDFLNGCKVIFETIKDFFNGIVDSIENYFTEKWIQLKNLIKNFKTIVTALIKLFADIVTETFAWIGDKINKTIIMPMMLAIYKALDALPGVDFSEEIKDLEEQLGVKSKEDGTLSGRIWDTIAKDVEEFYPESEEKDTINWKNPSAKEKGDLLANNFTDIVSELLQDKNATKQKNYEAFKSLYGTNIVPLGLPAFNSKSGDMNQSNSIVINGANQTPESIAQCVVEKVEEYKNNGQDIMKNSALVTNFCLLGGASAQ